MPIHLIIADDHALFRQGLRSLLSLEPDIVVTSEVASTALLQDELDRSPCDILLLDLQMDRWTLDDRPSLARRTKVIVLTASESAEHGIAALQAGARSLVQKRYAAETLMTAIHVVNEGQVWMPPAVQLTFVSPQEDSPRRLTSREAEIIRLVAMGMRNAEVAERLCLTEKTVKTHLTGIFQQLGIRDRVSLTHYALKHGLVNLNN
jgi:DNA-binding NarL/FixJ family response regulator